MEILGVLTYVGLVVALCFGIVGVVIIVKLFMNYYRSQSVDSVIERNRKEWFLRRAK